MAGRGPESSIGHQQTAPQMQENHPEPQDSDKKGIKERGARFWRNLSAVQGAVALGVGTVLSGGAAAAAYGVAAWNAGEVAVGHKIVKNEEKKRKEKKEIIEAKNGEYASGSNRNPGELPLKDISPTGQFPRSRRAGNHMSYGSYPSISLNKESRSSK